MRSDQSEVEGFNSIKRLEANPPKPDSHPFKWLDFHKLSHAFIVKNDCIQDVYFFTALATWNPKKVKRHIIYINALKSKGVKIILGKIKERYKKCYACGASYISHEEKQTDVNIAIHLLKPAVKDN